MFSSTWMSTIPDSWAGVLLRFTPSLSFCTNPACSLQKLKWVQYNRTWLYRHSSFFEKTIVSLEILLLSCLKVRFCLSAKLVDISFCSMLFPKITFFTTFCSFPPSFSLTIWAYLRFLSGTSFGILGLPLFSSQNHHLI